MVDTPVSGPEQLPTQQAWLISEVKGWVRDGLVTEEQADLIAQRYSGSADSSRHLHRLRIASAFAALGAVLVGIGVILILGVNWEMMPKAFRLAILIGSSVGFYGAGFYWAYERKTYVAAGEALLLIGSLIFGASIFLIGQMYHRSGPATDGEWVTGLMWWLIGIAPLAYLLASRLQMALALAVGTTWLVMTLTTMRYSYSPYPPFVLVLCIGTLLYAAGLLHARTAYLRKLTPVIVAFGVAYVLFCLFSIATMFQWDHALTSDLRHGWGILPSVVLAAGAFAAAVLAFVPSPSADESHRDFERWAGIGGIVLALGASAFIVLADGVLRTSGPHGDGMVGGAIYANLLLLAVELAVIALGWRMLSTGLVNVGLCAFFIHVMMRYFDLIGSMLSGGIAFVVTGLVLLAVGWGLERSRRRILESMRTQLQESLS